MWELYKAGYRTVNFVHDEAIVELPNDHTLQHHVKEVDRILLESMGRVIRHVRLGVGGALMDRWIKGAGAVFDRSGTMLVYTEGCMEAEKAEHRKTPGILPLLTELEGLSRDEIESRVPAGFRVLWKGDGSVFGYQPEREIVPQHVQGENDATV